MYRPGYGVVTTVVTVLCAIAVFTVLVAPRIPRQTENSRMVEGRDDFLREARFEEIGWQPFGPAAIADAQRLDRPILLMIGSPTSNAGRRLDQLAFEDPEVAAMLNARFTCARIDGAVHPEWINAILPFSRLRDPFRPDMQLWALDARGQEYDSILRAKGDEDFLATSILPRLVEIRREYDALGTSGTNTAGSAQIADMQLLEQGAIRVGRQGRRRSRSGRGSRAFDLYSAMLRSISERTDGGGFPVKGWVEPAPHVWRYLVRSGDFHSFDWSVVGGILRSTMLDLLDGGFFHTQTTGDGRSVEFDKLTVENADAMLALAEYSIVTSDPSARRIAEETWRYLVNSWSPGAGFVQGQIGGEGYRMRSARYSVPARRLRDAAPDSLQNWARENLGLDVNRFPQAVPFLESDVLFDPRLSEVMNALRRSAGPLPPTADAGLTDVSLTCTARSIEVARLWGDGVRLSQALEWLGALESVRSGSDIIRRIGNRPGEIGYLGDYLAYADAHLQAYLATGDRKYFDAGLFAVRRARQLFPAPGRPQAGPGIWVLNPPGEKMLIPNSTVPEVADNLHESCTARVIRLLMGYGRLLGPTPEGLEDVRMAAEAVRALRSIASVGGPLSAGFFCAAAEVYDPGFAIAVGPNARGLADAVVGLSPTRLVAPATGSVRPDLQSRAPGVYVVREKVTGPLSPTQARRLLGPVYALTAPPPQATRPRVRP